MRRLRPGFLLLLGLFALTLGGCLESRTPLFDEAKAVTPAPAGRYRQQVYKYGRWEEGDAGALTVEGHSYRWKPEGENDAQFFSVYDIGKGFYMVAEHNGNAPDDRYLYGLFEVTKDGSFLAYTPTCADLMNLRLPKEDLPAVEGSDCFFSDRDTLVRSLKHYSEVLQPTSRFVPIKPQ